MPIPNSGLLQPDGQWSALRICEALHAQGIGQGVEAALKRERAVPKQAGGSRQPPERHYESFGKVLPWQTNRVILVDDVVTRGATALGAAWRILEAIPGVDVKLFAMARTVWSVDEVRGFVEVVRGTITQESYNYLRRVP